VSRAPVSPLASARRKTSKKVGQKPITPAAVNLCVLLDAIGYIEDVTPEAAQFLQKSRDALLHIPFAALVSEESRRFWLTHFLSNRQPGTCGKTRLELKIGTSKRAVEVFTETSASWGTLRFAVTLQETSSAHRQKNWSCQVLSNLIGQLYDLVITVDRRGNVVFTNQPILDRLPNQVVGTSFYDYVRPHDLKRFRAAIDDAFASGTSTDFINKGLVRFPTGKYFRVRMKPLLSKAGRLGKASETELTMIVFDDVTDQLHAQEHLSRIGDNRQREARRANLIREEERRRLALELHDQLGQSLTALKIDLSLARRQVTKGRARSAIVSVESSVDQLISLVRELSAELRPPLLDDLGLVEALQFHMEAFQKRTGIHCTFKTGTAELSTSIEIAIGVFRVFQESLTNVIRHSRASKVEVGLEVHRGWLVLTVSDNGRGITEEEVYSPNSLGVIGMGERAQQLGGAIDIQNGLTEGTTVVMRVPLSGHGGLNPRKQR
jgi:signal transduction histidine kinase